MRRKYVEKVVYCILFLHFWGGDGAMAAKMGAWRVLIFYICPYADR
ncbi:hypothetical protein [uncultured Fibrobacter sp.]|nr:hypothetical protein [uncultured Fibrobacter sp.]